MTKNATLTIPFIPNPLLKGFDAPVGGRQHQDQQHLQDLAWQTLHHLKWNEALYADFKSVELLADAVTGLHCRLQVDLIAALPAMVRRRRRRRRRRRERVLHLLYRHTPPPMNAREHSFSLPIYILMHR